jgi:hypothetical protein
MTYTVTQVQQLLQELRDRDQKLLYQENLDWEEFNQFSRRCCKVIEEVISQYEEISIPKFGIKTSNNAWLLVQHMDWNRKFQQKYLDIMLKNPDDFDPTNIAYLTDRVLVGRNKPQIYGTQFQNHIEEGVYRPFPTDDPKNVNLRRAEVGLETIEEYAKHWPTADLSDFYNQ